MNLKKDNLLTQKGHRLMSRHKIIVADSRSMLETADEYVHLRKSAAKQSGVRRIN